MTDEVGVCFGSIDKTQSSCHSLWEKAPCITSRDNTVQTSTDNKADQQKNNSSYLIVRLKIISPSTQSTCSDVGGQRTRGSQSTQRGDAFTPHTWWTTLWHDPAAHVRFARRSLKARTVALQQDEAHSRRLSPCVCVCACACAREREREREIERERERGGGLLVNRDLWTTGKKRWQEDEQQINKINQSFTLCLSAIRTRESSFWPHVPNLHHAPGLVRVNEAVLKSSQIGGL